jgi:hypothetical protein
MIYLPTAEDVEVPYWLTNTEQNFLNFINDSETRFYRTVFSNSIPQIKFTQISPQIRHLSNEIEKYHIEVIEV